MSNSQNLGLLLNLNSKLWAIKLSGTWFLLALNRITRMVFSWTPVWHSVPYYCVVTSDYVGYAYLATPQHFVQMPAVNSSLTFQVHDGRSLYRISKGVIVCVTSKRHRREDFERKSHKYQCPYSARLGKCVGLVRASQHMYGLARGLDLYVWSEGQDRQLPCVRACVLSRFLIVPCHLSAHAHSRTSPGGDPTLSRMDLGCFTCANRTNTVYEM